MELYACCKGNWAMYVQENFAAKKDLEKFMEYAATFLSNVGNYYGSGDQKFGPSLGKEALKRLASISLEATRLFSSIAEPLTSIPPFSLGYASDRTQSAYYPSPDAVSEQDAFRVSSVLESHSIFPENTRVRKAVDSNGSETFEILQASVERDENARELTSKEPSSRFHLVRGDHAEDLAKICASLEAAVRYAANDAQRSYLLKCIESFRTGDLDAYRESQREWVRDKAPHVESIFGFVEPYRDPHGIRAEFEGLVAILDPAETRALSRLVEHSDDFIRRLPWAGGDQNNGKGSFEKALFEPPDFTSIHSLAYCSSIIFPGINLPNYNDIRQDNGFKNVIIANRMSAEGNIEDVCPFVDQSEAETFQKHKFAAYYLYVVIHELLGHGTSKLLVENEDGTFNFEGSPLSPLTLKPIDSWYRPGQTWTGQFGDLATTLDECRAELVGIYLMDDKDLLNLLGYSETSMPTCDEVTYNAYLQVCVDGLRGLRNFNVESGKWGHAHSRAHFAMLKCILREGNTCASVEFDPDRRSLTVRVDRSKIEKGGKVALGNMLLRLHIYRCTADVQICRSYFEDLSRVEGEYLEWREIVLAKNERRKIFVHANTFLDGDKVSLREYEPTYEGIIESWAERKV
ncbi:MAG: hypothetical protein M1822_003717 [Bathelium mastoideum]|nr:MAG: hypothetical protein M1822_003717 [Bathelium mastoideum]